MTRAQILTAFAVIVLLVLGAAVLDIAYLGMLRSWMGWVQP